MFKNNDNLFVDFYLDVDKATTAFTIPGFFPKVISILRTQEAQVIPVIVSFIVSSAPSPPVLITEPENIFNF